MNSCSADVRYGSGLLLERRLRVSAPSRIRTCGLLLRRESLYPAELSGPSASLRLCRAVSSACASAAASPDRCSRAPRCPLLPNERPGRAREAPYRRAAHGDARP
jgi:hypothetical protein